MKGLVAALLVDLAGVHVTYHGGPVISKTQVVVVLWGPGTYVPEIARTSPAPSITDFYAQALNSPYLDWLAEYNTSHALYGTNQQIGRGEFMGRFTIMPSIKRTQVSDAEIQSELLHQIAIGALPAPRQSQSNFPETYYAVFFPKEVSAISQGQTFCAYHNAMDSPFGHLYYSVHPDMSVIGTSCGLNLFGLNTPFEVATYLASHELLESITNPLAKLAAVKGLALSWYDANPAPGGRVIGEIGDICIYRDDAPKLTSSGGAQYKIAPGWSNVADQCVAATTMNDFDLTLEPAAALLQSNTASIEVKTQVVFGKPENISLYVQGLPAEISSQISPNPIKAGSSATITLSTNAQSLAPLVQFQVKGIALSTNHVASAELITTLSPVIRTRGRAVFSIGEPGVFQINASGSPTPQLSASGLPLGLVFADEGDGIGRISGIPAPGQVGPHTITLTAAAGLALPTTESLSLVVEKGHQSIQLSVPQSVKTNSSFSANSSGGVSSSPTLVNATGACSKNGDTVFTGQQPGVCLITAGRAGDANYNAAPEQAIAVGVGEVSSAASCDSTRIPIDMLSLITFAFALRLFLKTKRSLRR